MTNMAENPYSYRYSKSSYDNTLDFAMNEFISVSRMSKSPIGWYETTVGF